MQLKLTKDKPFLLTSLGLLGLFVVNVYRAATQSLTHDEARTWRNYLLAPWDEAFGSYWTNNHILHSLLARVITSIFGFSALSIRGASLLAGAGFFVGVLLLCRLMFGHTWRACTITFLACLNPFILDFTVAARGYGMGLAFMVWAIYAMAQALCVDLPLAPSTIVDRWWGVASIMLGLSISSNLIYLFPCTALAASFIVMVLPQPFVEVRTPLCFAHFKRLVLRFALPGPVLAAAICAPALRHVDRGSFDMGIPTLMDSAVGLLQSALQHHVILWSAAAEKLSIALGEAIFLVLLPAGLWFYALVAQPMFWKWRTMKGGMDLPAPKQRWLFLLVLSAILMAAIYLVAHVFLGVRFPDPRAGTYVITLATLLAPLLLDKMRGILRGRPRLTAVVNGLGVVTSAVTLSLYLLQFNVSHFREWRYDANDRAMFTTMMGRSEQSGHLLKIGGTGVLGPSMNYYYDRFHPAHLSRFLSADMAGVEVLDFDYLALTPGDADVLAERHPGAFKVILSDALSQTSLEERVR